MRLDELEDSLPNGFHDASIEGIVVDYVSQRATLQMKLLVSSPETETQSEREIYKRAELQLLGILYFVIEAPDPSYKYAEGKALTIDAGKTSEKSSPAPPIPLDQLPTGVSAYWFFVSDWNSFIHIAAMDAKLQWT